MKVLRSIKTKLLASQIGLLFFIAVILGGATYFVAVNFLKESQQTFIEHIVKDSTSKLNQVIMDQSMALEMLAAGDAIAIYKLKNNEQMLVEYFSKFVKEFPVIAYVNERGMEELRLVNGDKSTALLDIGKSKLFEDAIRKPNQVVVSYSPAGPALSTPHMEFAIYRRNFGEFEGLIIGRIPVTELFRDLSEFRFKETGFLMLLDTRGTLLSHPRANKVLQGVSVNGKHSEELVDRAKRMNFGFGRATIEGCDGYVAYAPVMGAWTVMAMLPYKDFMAAPKTLRNIFLAAFLVALFAGSFIALRIAASMTAPVFTLADVAGKIAKGDFSQKANIETRDEIGVLAVSFNKMAADFQEMIVGRDQEIAERKQAEEELRTYKENLEHMVEERTLELRAAQQEMVKTAMDAGRAQLSAMVLHNIGNAMTPVKVHVESMKSDEFPRIADYLEKSYADLCEHAPDLQRYVNDDPRGKEIFSFMGKLVDSLKSNTDRTKKVMNDIKDVCRYISDILTLQQSYAAKESETREQVDLNHLLEDAVKMQKGILEKRDIMVQMDLEPALPELLIDKSRLIQVIVNLIKNSYEAFDSLADQGRERRVILKSFHDPDGLGFEIIDTGAGISPAELGSVCEFGISGKGSSGFGLYYCKSFVEANHGTLAVSSPGKGKGTTIRIAFSRET